MVIIGVHVNDIFKNKDNCMIGKMLAFVGILLLNFSTHVQASDGPSMFNCFCLCSRAHDRIYVEKDIVHEDNSSSLSTYVPRFDHNDNKHDFAASISKDINRIDQHKKTSIDQMNEHNKMYIDQDYNKHTEILISINQLRKAIEQGLPALDYEACTDYLLRVEGGYEKYLEYTREYKELPKELSKERLEKLDDKDPRKIWIELNRPNGAVIPKSEGELSFREKRIPVYIAAYIIALEGLNYEVNL